MIKIEDYGTEDWRQNEGKSSTYSSARLDRR